MNRQPDSGQSITKALNEPTSIAGMPISGRWRVVAHDTKRCSFRRGRYLWLYDLENEGLLVMIVCECCGTDMVKELTKRDLA